MLEGDRLADHKVLAKLGLGFCQAIIGICSHSDLWTNTPVAALWLLGVLLAIQLMREGIAPSRSRLADALGLVAWSCLEARFFLRSSVSGVAQSGVTWMANQVLTTAVTSRDGGGTNGPSAIALSR